MGQMTICRSKDDIGLYIIWYKRTLSDRAVDRHIPETVRIDQNDLLKQSCEALERWVERKR